jgi:hypothetical protein
LLDSAENRPATRLAIHLPNPEAHQLPLAYFPFLFNLSSAGHDQPPRFRNGMRASRPNGEGAEKVDVAKLKDIGEDNNIDKRMFSGGIEAR